MFPPLLPLPLLPLLLLSPLPGVSVPPGPPLAAAGPVLEGGPFVVVWNTPTSRCQQRFSVSLDLEDFHIVQNREQRFQGQNMSLFYRDHLGKYPYLSRGGRRVNGGLPQLGHLTSHLSVTVTQVSALLRPDFSGLAVIDWEEWRPLWEENFGQKTVYRRLSEQLVRQRRPDLSDRDAAALARKGFEESAQRFMGETLRLAVKHRPNGLWGFYGFPACFNKHKRKTDQFYTGRCHRGTRQKNQRLRWLWRRSTALYPSVYLPLRLAGSADAALMVRHRVLEALRVASAWRPHPNHSTPVFPYNRLAFTHTLSFLNKTDLENTLGESAALGVAGVVLWGEVEFAKSKDQCVLLRDYIHTVLGPFIRSLRSDACRCSIRLCHGNGRCARRRLRSGHMFSSASDEHLQEHFMCRCYSGWTGHGCQHKE
ncbi:hyaluronidase-3 isoform X2 [Sphaeramia orbicularis]|uniref:Hyaluronidase n=2 Tax=Sphaeramia orbicularis TaxID=375764 RepID=A0A673APE3_9TELE|nr:hyaluronidase-3-like isoform X2 [Sphaeramia orbicularis]